MKTIKKAFGIGFAVAVVFSIVLGVTTLLSTPAEAGRCLCPKIYAPVVCSNGKTYSNQCLADCRNAHDCVPADTF
jgi:hypothetical protein